MLKRLSLASVTAFALMLHANAADFSYVAVSNDMLISGVIETGDAAKFELLTTNVNKRTHVALNSPGGKIVDAIAIARTIRQNKWDTYVLDGHKCNSSCTLIWLAGYRRHMGENAVLGFHSAARVLGECNTFEPGNDVMAQFMREMGAPKAIIEWQATISPCKMGAADYKTMKAWGLLEKPARPPLYENPARPLNEVVKDVKQEVKQISWPPVPHAPQSVYNRKWP
jgi:hypothetical protein